MKYLFATNNKNKVKELKLSLAGLEIISLAELGLFFEPAETGSTFEENAIQKVTETARFLKENGHDPQKENIAVLSDDSGLCVDFMGGLPGVDSANFMGRETPYEIRNNHIISKLNGVLEHERTARFVCIIACLFPNGEIKTTKGVIEGLITHEIKGENGFGYDPIFYVPKYGKTTAEINPEEKNKISHRGMALKEMVGFLNENISSK